MWLKNICSIIAMVIVVVTCAYVLHFPRLMSACPKNAVCYDTAWNMSSTQPYVTFSTFEFHSYIFVFSGIHMAPNYLTLHRQCLLCLTSGLFSCPVNGACLSCPVVLGWCTLPSSCIRSLTSVNQNCWCDNFEQKEACVIKLLRMVRSRRWENSLFVHHVVRCIHITSCVYYSLVIWLFSQLIHAHHRNYSAVVENACLPVCLHYVCPSTLWLSSYLSP